MTFGEPGKEGTRVHETRDIEAILDVFISHGHSEVSYDYFITHCNPTFL
jgi:aflatoxin B1 aldehyde reductase